MKVTTAVIILLTICAYIALQPINNRTITNPLDHNDGWKKNKDFGKKNASYSITAFSLSLINHAPIIITHNDNFTDYGFSGTGTELNPYKIERYNITTSFQRAISISNTTVYFHITNCYVQTRSSGDHIGIHVSSIALGTALITDNIIINNKNGIYIYKSNSSFVSNNTIMNNSYAGIYLYRSNFSVVANNIVSNCEVGIFSFLSISNMINSNTVSQNYQHGIHAWNSNSSTVANNLVTDNERGIRLFNAYSSTVVNNFVTDSQRNGIYLHGSFFNTVVNNTARRNRYEILIVYSSNNNIINNTATQTNYYPTKMFISHCNPFLPFSDLFPSAKIALAYSNLNMIINNTIAESEEHGIAFAYANGNTVINNHITQNKKFGVALAYSNANTFTHNRITYNFDGIGLVDSDLNKIYANLIANNTDYAIYIESGNNTTIYFNNIIDNKAERSQGYDDGNDNVWYNETLQLGNYWSDWSGDGIYAINGKAVSKDLYPLTELYTDEKGDEETESTFFTSITCISLSIMFIGLISLKWQTRKY